MCGQMANNSAERDGIREEGRKGPPPAQKDATPIAIMAAEAMVAAAPAAGEEGRPKRKAGWMRERTPKPNSTRAWRRKMSR